jgi:small subunit ribosomal protein S1
VVKGVVTNVTQFGAFVEVEEGIEGLLHVSEMEQEEGSFKKVEELYKVGQEVTAMIVHFDPKARRMGLSTKALAHRGEYREEAKPITLGDIIRR